MHSFPGNRLIPLDIVSLRRAPKGLSDIRSSPCTGGLGQGAQKLLAVMPDSALAVTDVVYPVAASDVGRVADTARNAEKRGMCVAGAAVGGDSLVPRH